MRRTHSALLTSMYTAKAFEDSNGFLLYGRDLAVAEKLEEDGFVKPPFDFPSFQAHRFAILTASGIERAEQAIAKREK